MNTAPPKMIATRVAAVFERICQEQMAGLPLLNKALSVTTLGFQEFEGRILGMLITPWMMSLVRFPGPQDDWQAQALGSKHSVALPGGNYRFLINVIDELGVCQMHSLHSPMHPFRTQEAAIAAATVFMDKLLVIPPGGVQHDPVDEELLGKILRGEKVPAMDKDGSLIPERLPQVSEPNPSLTETT
ncbi:MAG: [NiFe]-hydrogenase assembly chaperone HybE [Rhodoferax sp.]|nr:[NiFe]-hydrogenase assembly chaperone HybE [Rhodoferax sp.]